MRERPAKVLETEALPLKDYPEIEMERFRVEVGYQHGVKPGNIVGAIANEAELESRYIGHIEIFDDFSTVDLPAGMPKETMRDLQKTWVCQRKLAIRRLMDVEPTGAAGAEPKKRAGAKRKAAKSTDGPAARGPKGGATGKQGRRAGADKPPKASRGRARPRRDGD